MLHYESQPLNKAFHALSDPARRAMVERLSRGPASVSDLAQPLPMTLSAVVQHLKVLEESGLVTSAKVGRVRTCRLEPAIMTQVEHWIAERKRFWEQQYDQLEAYLASRAIAWRGMMTVTNATFAIERRLNAPPARVFAAYTSIAAKSAWFKTPSEVEIVDRRLDFRVGGEERFCARWPSGLTTDFQAIYHDIVENERIILVYDLFHDDTKLSVSLQTIELIADGGGTRLIHTEQGSYFSGGLEAVQGREHGTGWHVDNLVAMIEGREMRAFA